ncbi:MAG TPA: sigma-70 family RNA polymerase sigma factor [Polyangiales bacterium]|jgi:RNA polymerase sigma-70 factor (ECF subfamily)
MESYSRYGPALLRKAERMLRNRADAQDVVHALFLELLQQTTPRSDLPYLYRAVTNRCLNMLRDQSARARLLEHGVSPLEPMRTSCEARAIDLDLLTRLIALLDPATAEVLVYRYLDDMSQEEIAELLGLSRKTVGHKLARIREAMLSLSEPGGAP